MGRREGEGGGQVKKWGGGGGAIGGQGRRTLGWGWGGIQGITGVSEVTLSPLQIFYNNDHIIKSVECTHRPPLLSEIQGTQSSTRKQEGSHLTRALRYPPQNSGSLSIHSQHQSGIHRESKRNRGFCPRSGSRSRSQLPAESCTKSSQGLPLGGRSLASMNVVRHAGERARSDAGFGHQFHTICCLGDGQLQRWLFRQALRLWKRKRTRSVAFMLAFLLPHLLGNTLATDRVLLWKYKKQLHFSNKQQHWTITQRSQC